MGASINLHPHSFSDRFVVALSTWPMGIVIKHDESGQCAVAKFTRAGFFSSASEVEATGKGRLLFIHFHTETEHIMMVSPLTSQTWLM